MDKKLTIGLVSVLLLGSGFAFAKKRKANLLSVSPDTTDETGSDRKTVLVNWYSLHGKTLKPNQYVFASQGNIPLVGVPDQKAGILATVDKGAQVGQFTGKVVTDYKYFKEGLTFLEVIRQGKNYFVSISHVETA
jgi:hypothetical protein